MEDNRRASILDSGDNSPRKCSVMRRLLTFLAGPCLLAAVLNAQTLSEDQDYTYTIPTAQPWTDTGLDLQTGDSLQITTGPSVPDRHSVSGATSCDPKGVSGDTAQSAELPLSLAPTGALIARLHAQGAAPMLVGAGSDLQIQEPSHLFLGVNAQGTAPCQGIFAVRVHRTRAGTSATVPPSSTTSTPQAQTLATTSTTLSSTVFRHSVCACAGPHAFKRFARRTTAQKHRQPSAPDQRSV
jgi:hypothetical protein